MLGYEVAQSTVSKYMARVGTPPSQSWKTFLRNHAEAIAAIDLCVVPTLSFELLFAFLVLGHGRRQLLWFEVAASDGSVASPANHRSVPWASAPPIWSAIMTGPTEHVFTTRVTAMGIRDRPISPGSPWQNGYCGTSDRHYAPRVLGSNADLWRGALAPNSCFVRGVLQSSAHASGITERCALASIGPTVWRHRRHSHFGGTASSIRADMIFGKDTGLIGLGVAFYALDLAGVTKKFLAIFSRPLPGRAPPCIGRS